MSEKDSNVTTYGAGQVLCRKGEKSTDLYFIREGKCEIIVTDRETGNEMVVGTAEPGSVLGIMSFLEGEPRAATLKAQTELKCTVVKSMQREKLLNSIPKWFKALLKQMSADLKRVDHKLLELTEEHTKLKKRYEILKAKVGEDPKNQEKSAGSEKK